MSIRLEKGAQRTWLLPLLLVLIGVAVRLWQLGAAPCGLNQDEAYAGYEAYSLLTYGVDSWGYHNPCYFISWGSGMNVLESYLAMPFVAVLGLTELAIRLPQAILGCVSLPVMYLLLTRLFSRRVGLLGLALTAICPWHIMLSRWGLESNLAPGLLLLGLYFLVRGLDSPPWLLACAVFAFVIMGGAVKFGVYLATGAEDPEDLPFYVETPLYMTDLVGEQEMFFSNATSSDQSLLLQRLKVEQFPWGREDETPQMTYERYTVSVPALYSFCVGQMKRQMLIKAYWDGEMVPVDATPWGAEEAYRLVAKDGTQRNAFLLCRGNILVSVDMSWEPTAEQMALVGERLLNS